MRRKAILNFISLNFDSLSRIKVKRCSIFLFGIDYKDTLYKDILNGEKCFSFDIKLPRIDEKTFPLDKMNEGLLDMSQHLDNVESYSKEDFNDEIDPYSSKRIFDLDFNYLTIVPIIKDGLHQGVILIYSLESDNLKIQGITRLITELTESYQYEINNYLHNTILQNDYYYVLENDKGKYLSDDKIDYDEFIHHHSTKRIDFPFPNEGLTCYYGLKEEMNSKNLGFYHPSTLNSVKLKTNFSLLILESESSSYVSKLSSSINLDNKIFDFEDNIYLILIDGKVSNSNIPSIKEYNIKIDSPKHINSKMNLRKIVSFVKEFRPIEFDIDEYKEYISSLGSERLKVDTYSLSKGMVINSTDNSNVGTFINEVPNDFKYLDNKYLFEKKCFSLLKKYVEEHNDVYIGVMSSTILKRKMKELYKKYHENNLKLNLIIHYDVMQSREELIDSLVYLKNNNIGIYFDSSIILNLKMTDLFNIPNGIYLRKEETMSMVNSKESLINQIMAFFFNNEYKVLFEKTGNESKDNNYRSPDIYFVERK